MRAFVWSSPTARIPPKSASSNGGARSTSPGNQDDFIVWKTTQLQKDVEVHVYQHHRAELTRTFCDELTYQHYHFNPATDEGLPLKWQVGGARARPLVKLGCALRDESVAGAGGDATPGM